MDDLPNSREERAELEAAYPCSNEDLEARRAYCYAANAAERRDAAERVAEAERKQRELDAR